MSRSGTRQAAEMPALFRLWAVVTAAMAIALTSADLWLLERSRGLFTGGFLNTDRLETTGEIGGFIAVSLLVDGAVAGLAAALVMFVLARRMAARRAAIAAALMIGAGPLLVADIVSFRILQFLGADFDLGLMFDLTGRSVAEVLAVASSQLVVPLLALVGLIVAGGVVVWRLNRPPAVRLGHASARLLWPPALLVVAAAMALVWATAGSDALRNLLRKPSGRVLAFGIAAATDVDRDGYGLIGAMRDPDPWNASVFPYAPEVPGNGVDEDGVAGDLPADAARDDEGAPLPAPWRQRPDVVLVALESFRADLLGRLYRDQPVTPVMNRLAAAGAAARRAYSHNGYTVQSRFHLMAGALVPVRGAPTLVDDFTRNGYVVGYFSGQDESFGSDDYKVGFDRADVAADARSEIARRYSTSTTPGSLAVPYQVVLEHATRFAGDRGGDARPMFMYVNFEDTHFPYAHDGIESLVSDIRVPRDGIVPANRDALWATYVNTAANIDRAIGVLLDAVRQARGREPAIVITADHGESLFDAGFLGHGYALSDVQTQVPFIAANLAVAIPDPLGHADLRRMINDALSAAPDSRSGPTLVPAGRPVFQYLGEIHSPRQIGFVTSEGRLVHDFRTGLVQRADTWMPVSALPEAAHREWLQLIRQWEWLNRERRQNMISPPPRDGK